MFYLCFALSALFARFPSIIYVLKKKASNFERGLVTSQLLLTRTLTVGCNWDLENDLTWKKKVFHLRNYDLPPFSFSLPLCVMNESVTE